MSTYNAVVRTSVVLVALLVLVSAAPAAPGGEIKLAFWTWHARDADVAKAFMRLKPHIVIDTIVIGAWDLEQKLVTAVAAGRGAPDVSRVIARRFYLFMGPKRGMTDLTDRALPLRQYFPESQWVLMVKDGRVYGLPTEWNLVGLYYRKDIYDKYGLVPPETWEQLVEQGRFLREKAGLPVLPLWVPGRNTGADHFKIYLHSRGVNIFTKDGRLIEHNSAAKEVLRWYVALAREHNVAWTTQMLAPEFWAGMNADRFATWPMLASIVGSIRRFAPGLAGKWSRAPLPIWRSTGHHYNAEMGSSGMAIPSQTKHLDEAWEFLQYYAASIPGQVLSFELAAAIPAFRPAREQVLDLPDPYFSNTTLRNFIGDRRTPPFYYWFWAEASEILGNEIDAAFAGMITPDQAWENFEQKMKSAMKR
jgi:ABC-type glycerol-3-phosphate transport system substrate-binding protein